MAMPMVQRPPITPVTALLSKPVQAKLDFDRTGPVDPLHASHLANMPVFYKRLSNTRNAYIKQRHPAIKAHVNVASPQFANDYPTTRPRTGANFTRNPPPGSSQLLFLGVTRDHLVDGKAALDHPDAAGRFTVDAAGVVTIIQPKETLENIPLGADLFWTQDKFSIGSDNIQSYRMTHVRVQLQGARNIRMVQIPFGRLVEKRMKNVCEARVLLYSNDSVAFQPDNRPRPDDAFAAVGANPGVNQRVNREAIQREAPVEEMATTGANFGEAPEEEMATTGANVGEAPVEEMAITGASFGEAQAELESMLLDAIVGDKTVAPPPKKRHKNRNRSAK